MGDTKFKPQYRRLLFIDRMIRQGNYPNCTGLAKSWEASPRTIQRDIEYLKDSLDAPLEYDAVKHGYYYTDEAWFVPSVIIGEGELLALLIGTQVARMFEGTPVADELTHIYDKLAGILPDKVTLAPEMVFNKFSFTHAPSRRIHPEVWKGVIRALLHQQVIEIKYDSPRAKEPKTHVLHPYHIANLAGEWYILAKNERFEDLSQYALGRVLDVTIREERFTTPAGQDLRKVIEQQFGRFVGSGKSKPHNLRLLFQPEVTQYVSERDWHPDQKLKQKRDGRVELSFPVHDFLEVRAWILSFGSAVQVLGPKGLRDEVVGEWKRAARE